MASLVTFYSTCARATMGTNRATTSTSHAVHPRSVVHVRRQLSAALPVSARGGRSTAPSRGTLVVRNLRPGEAEPLPLVQVEGLTPEAKAAKSLKTFFTMVAVRVVLDQMQGTRHRQPIAKDVIAFLYENPITDGQQWLAKLMKHDQPRMRMVAVRVIEVRKVFAEEEFDWEKAQKLAMTDMKDDNLTFQRHMLESNASFDSFDQGSN